MAMAFAARPQHVDAGMERRTALMAAAAEGSVDVLAQLLENGAQMSVRSVTLLLQASVNSPPLQVNY
tara:strand:+ start:419 stop:619 length:201 start_codon:yes stop_codon:yes gene_type:complete